MDNFIVKINHCRKGFLVIRILGIWFTLRHRHSKPRYHEFYLQTGIKYLHTDITIQIGK